MGQLGLIVHDGDQLETRIKLVEDGLISTFPETVKAIHSWNKNAFASPKKYKRIEMSTSWTWTFSQATILYVISILSSS